MCFLCVWVLLCVCLCFLCLNMYVCVCVFVCKRVCVLFIYVGVFVFFVVCECVFVCLRAFFCV